ncbi:MAG TPA: iron-containing redox enzyme family protein [Candidatus Solibacter sp.]|jgi:pyrroloquinoline-quinone synthase|nr:iron-containing redox enzyme family protein [Candidatus Solibacter sp.]
MSIEELRAVATRWDLLTHGFYQRWVAGDLSLDELEDYACQYHQVVKAIPGWMRQAAAGDDATREVLESHAVEEESHVEMWADFAISLGVTADQLTSTVPNDATRALLEAGDALSSSGNGAAVVWALEAQTPAVSVAKLDGLREHYGIDAGNGGRYFDLHKTMDLEHADELEGVIEADSALAASAPAAAATMLEGLWNLLSSVERPPVPA